MRVIRLFIVVVDNNFLIASCWIYYRYDWFIKMNYCYILMNS